MAKRHPDYNFKPKLQRNTILFPIEADKLKEIIRTIHVQRKLHQCYNLKK